MLSGNTESRAPDRLYIKESDKKDYDALLEESGSPFEGKENKHVFMMAVITGFRDGSRRELDRRKDLIRIEYLSPKELSVIKALAIAETGSLDVLLNKKEVYSIAEEYAAGGIKLLKAKVSSGGFGSYVNRLEESLVSAFEEIEKRLG